ncbi:MAG: VCBS repeat-containing protein, partial [Oxalobacteraceae bacterium]|nr:VCBS repeat-containing protein [Oxalobacteraceae bacterium]
VTAIRHYVTTGYNAGRRISFDALAYIASHGDLIAAFGTDALAGVKHYLNWGYKEGRQVIFDALGYLSRHTDLQQAFGSDTVAATKHYINWGFKEGREYSFTVSVSITGAGSVSQTTQYVRPGEKATFTFLPEKGFFIDSVKGCEGVLKSGVYTTGPIRAGCVVTARFERDTPVLVRIPDSVDYYKSLCSTAIIQFVIPVRLNQDNTSDFIVHYWCPPAGGSGSVLTTPTPDALVALVSQSDGSYKVENERVFGERLYKLGGASRKHVSGDINGDGRTDFAFAMNWEDGRLAKDPNTNATQLSVLLSTGEFGYRVVRLGKPNWNHAVEIVRNETSVDVVTAGFICCESVQAFRFQAGAFSDVSAEYVTNNASWASAFRAINDQRTGIARQIVGVTNRQIPGANGNGLQEIGIQFLERARTGWSVLSEFWQRVDFLVKWISWQRTEGTNTVISIDGRQYFGGSYDEFCVMPSLRPGGPRLLLAKLGVAKDKFGRQLVAGGSYDEYEAKPVNMFVFYEIEEGQRIKQISSPIVNEEIESNFNFFDCGKDVNNDDLPDLVVYAFTRPGFGERVAERGKPTIYLNDGNGKLVRADLSGWPGHSAGNELQSIMTDVNGDGVIDLVLYGSASDSGGGVIEIYLMRAPARL